MINEARARLILFSIIEPASPFWSYEINQRGGLSVYERIISGRYYLKQKDILKIQQQVMQWQVKDLELEISKAGGDVGGDGGGGGDIGESVKESNLKYPMAIGKDMQSYEGAHGWKGFICSIQIMA